MWTYINQITDIDPKCGLIEIFADISTPITKDLCWSMQEEGKLILGVCNNFLGVYGHFFF